MVRGARSFLLSLEGESLRGDYGLTDRMPLVEFKRRLRARTGQAWRLGFGTVPVFTVSDRRRGIGARPDACESVREVVGWPNCFPVGVLPRLPSGASYPGDFAEARYIDCFEDCADMVGLPAVAHNVLIQQNERNYCEHFGVRTRDAGTSIEGFALDGTGDVVLTVNPNCVTGCAADDLTGGVLVPLPPSLATLGSLTGHYSTGDMKSVTRSVVPALSSHRIDGLRWNQSHTYRRLSAARCFDDSVETRIAVLEGAERIYNRVLGR